LYVGAGRSYAYEGKSTPVAEVPAPLVFRRYRRDSARPKGPGVGTDAETVRLAIERVVEMEEFRRFMQESRKTLKPGSIALP
jgi:hypothetical protein